MVLSQQWCVCSLRVSTAEDGTTGKLDLVITKLRDEDVGEYTCSATYAGNKKLEANITVESFSKSLVVFAFL